jgi:hypothetical protein
MSSKKDPWYRQCKFKTVEPPIKIDTAWIPEKFAKVGKKVYFGDKRPDPEPIWVVIEVYARKPESYVVARQMDYKHQRKVSDV